MQQEKRPAPDDLVFPSSTGTVRSPHNFRRQWRDAIDGTGYEWVTPHVFRKTVTTLIDRQYGSKNAAAQLGHSGSAIIEKHYIAKAVVTPDLTKALDQLGAPEPAALPPAGRDRPYRLPGPGL
jgi:integrase